MKKAFWGIILFSIAVLFLQSCSTVYYVGQTTTPTNIYSNQDTTSTVSYNVPIGTKLLIKKKYKKYYYVVYDTYTGYSYKTIFTNYHRFNSTDDGDLYGYSTTKKKSSSSSTTSSGGTVNVKGYYRKNGTYVQPHTRSSPTRKH